MPIIFMFQEFSMLKKPSLSPFEMGEIWKCLLFTLQVSFTVNHGHSSHIDCQIYEADVSFEVSETLKQDPEWILLVILVSGMEVSRQ